MSRSFTICLVALFIGTLLHQTTKSAASSPQNNKAKNGPSVVQNFYGFSTAQDIVKRLNQITRKLNELDRKLSSCIGTTSNCSADPKNCAEVYNCGHKTSGVYKINPDGKGLFSVYCDQVTDGGGWTVVQKRLDGSTDFFRGWSEYKHGFGNLKKEFWLGLDKIHRLTHQQGYKLRVDLEDWDRKTAYAVYGLFGVADEKNKYKLSLGSYAGTAGDSLAFHRGMAFSTKDRDNDTWNKNCATQYKGAWWYESCHYSNLNGRYLHGGNDAKGTAWYKWKNAHYSVKTAAMKIRPVSFVPSYR